MDFLKYQEHKVYYVREGQGKPIIFLHNAGNDHHIWDFQIKEFKKTHEVFAIDMIGFGRSDRPSIEYTLSFYSDMLTAFIKKNRLSNVVLIGHCVGAAISLKYALHNPGNVNKLVLFNIATEQTLRKGAYGHLYRLTKNRVIKNFLNQMAGQFVPPEWARFAEIRKQYGKESESDNNFLEYLQKLYSNPLQVRILYNLLLNFKSFRVLDEIEDPKYLPPVCLIWGELNQILRVKGGKEFAKKLQPDKTVILDGCGHMLMREEPEKVNEILYDFIG